MVHRPTDRTDAGDMARPCMRFAVRPWVRRATERHGPAEQGNRPRQTLKSTIEELKQALTNMPMPDLGADATQNYEEGDQLAEAAEEDRRHSDPEAVEQDGQLAEAVVAPRPWRKRTNARG